MPAAPLLRALAHPLAAFALAASLAVVATPAIARQPEPDSLTPRTDPSAITTSDPAADVFADPNWSQRVDTSIRESMAEHDIPGAGVVIVVDGQVVFLRGYGLANIATGEPVDPEHTIFRIGSISKALTLLTLTRLIDDGRLDPDTDVSSFVKSIDNPLGLKEPVTIEHLLTHTSGFDQLGGYDRQIRQFNLSLDERKALRPALDDYLSAGRLRRVSPAGLHYRYDTYGSTLAGLVLERVTGRPYAEAMRQEMFEPLGMATAHVEAPDDLLPRLARGYEEEDGELVPQPYEVYVTAPASSIDATVADMARLLQALTGDGRNAHGRLFSEPMTRAVLAPQFRPHPEFAGTTHGLHESVDAGGQFGAPVRTVDHGGSMAGYRTLLAVIPDGNIGIYAAINRGDVRRNPVAEAALQALVASLRNKPARVSREVPAPDPAADLGQYTGEYYYGVFNHAPTREEAANGAWRRGSAFSVVVSDGALLIREEEYRSLGSDLFVSADGHRRVYFGRDESGRVSFFTYDSSPDTFERERSDLPYPESGIWPD